MNDQMSPEDAVDEAAYPLDLLQSVALKIYGQYDVSKSLLWLTEEVGELISAHRKGKPRDEILGELADVLAWVICLSNIFDASLSELATRAMKKEIVRQLNTYGQLKYYDT